MNPLYQALICCFVKFVLSMRKLMSSFESFLLDFPPIFPCRRLRRWRDGGRTARAVQPERDMTFADGVEGWRQRYDPACVLGSPSGIWVDRRPSYGVPREPDGKNSKWLPRSMHDDTTAALINAPSSDLSRQAEAEPSQEDGEGQSASQIRFFDGGRRRCYVYSP